MLLRNSVTYSVLLFLCTYLCIPIEFGYAIFTQKNINIQKTMESFSNLGGRSTKPNIVFIVAGKLLFNNMYLYILILFNVSFYHKLQLSNSPGCLFFFYR